MQHFTRPCFLFMILILLGNGCGYHFSGEGSGPRPGLKHIAIPVFENNTSEPGLESLFAAALRREFILRSRLQVVPENEAEAVLRGRIIDIHTSSVAHREFDETIATRLFLTLDIRCEDTQTGKILWQDPHFTYHKVYFQNPDPVNRNPLINFENRRQALEFLAREMSVRIHDRFLSNF